MQKQSLSKAARACLPMNRTLQTRLDTGLISMQICVASLAIQIAFFIMYLKLCYSNIVCDFQRPPPPPWASRNVSLRPECEVFMEQSAETGCHFENTPTWPCGPAWLRVREHRVPRRRPCPCAALAVTRGSLVSCCSHAVGPQRAAVPVPVIAKAGEDVGCAHTHRRLGATSLTTSLPLFRRQKRLIARTVGPFSRTQTRTPALSLSGHTPVPTALSRTHPPPRHPALGAGRTESCVNVVCCTHDS